MCLLSALVFASTMSSTFIVVVAGVGSSRRDLKDAHVGGGGRYNSYEDGQKEGEDCEYEGVWTKHEDYYTSEAGKTCTCDDSKWKDCWDTYEDQPEVAKAVYYVEDEPKKYKDCEKHGVWVKHGDLYVFDDQECRCWDSSFDSCKSIEKHEPEIKYGIIKEEPKEQEYKDCEEDGEWIKHGDSFTIESSHEKCRCWDGEWDSCAYDDAYEKPPTYEQPWFPQPPTYEQPWYTGRR